MWSVWACQETRDLSRSVHPWRRTLHLQQDKCTIIRRWEKKRERKEEIKERGGGAREVAILQMGKVQAPINLTKPGPPRYCQPLRAKQIAWEISWSQTRKATKKPQRNTLKREEQLNQQQTRYNLASLCTWERERNFTLAGRKETMEVLQYGNFIRSP